MGLTCRVPEEIRSAATHYYSSIAPLSGLPAQKVITIIIVLLYSRNDIAVNCTDGSLRLVGGASYREGRVEVCVDNCWGTVCGEGWTERDAGNVCSKLGYPSTSKSLMHN